MAVEEGEGGGDNKEQQMEDKDKQPVHEQVGKGIEGFRGSGARNPPEAGDAEAG